MKNLSPQEKKILGVLRPHKNGISAGTIGELLEPRTFQGRKLSMPLHSLYREGLVEFLHSGKWRSCDDQLDPPHDPQFVVYYRLTNDGERACKELDIY
jgi:hypothetical protein